MSRPKRSDLDLPRGVIAVSAETEEEPHREFRAVIDVWEVHDNDDGETLMARAGTGIVAAQDFVAAIPELGSKITDQWQFVVNTAHMVDMEGEDDDDDE